MMITFFGQIFTVPSKSSNLLVYGLEPHTLKQPKTPIPNASEKHQAANKTIEIDLSREIGIDFSHHIRRNDFHYWCMVSVHTT